LVALGYTGWGEAQLDEEMTRHGWFNVHGAESLIFDIAVAARWEAGFEGAGIDPRLLAVSAGTA
ncbi:YqgE/AlgH family protein, partial [Sphingomonas sp. AX6]